MQSSTNSIRTLGRGLALVLALCPAIACDGGDKGGDKAEAGDKAEGGDAAAESEKAKAANAEVAEMKAKLDKGEDIKFGCAGNLAQYEDLSKSSDESEKKAYQSMLDLCFVEAPTKMIADLRAKIEKGELDTFDTVDLQTTLDDDKFPKEGKAAEVAADARKLLEVEVPHAQLKKHMVDAKKEKEAGEAVSMGCIKAKQVVEKHGEKLATDEAAKATVEEFKATCPEK